MIECVAVENDCEDQGFGLLSDGCVCCGNAQKKQPLEKTTTSSGTWWMCPKCHASYGAVE